MSERKTRRLVREMLSAIRRALPAMREADRAYRALTRPQTEVHRCQRRPKGVRRE